LLDLVALGTLADLMPLVAENRILVKLGMQSLHTTKREGLRVLLLKLKLLGKPLTTTDVSWQLIPTINAAGRLGHPEKAVELLLTTDDARRRKLADELDGLNQQRKQMSQDAWEQVLPLARASHEALGGNLVLVVSETVPRGITGLVASRLVSTFGVPGLVLTRTEGKYIGSLRANRGFETRRFLDSFQDIFTDYGGHDQAAGFNLPDARLADFQARLTKILPDFPLGGDGELTLTIDAELPLAFFTPDLMLTVDKLEPYGEGHRPLVFVARGLLIIALDLVGKTGAQHVKLTLDAGATKWPAIFFHALERLEAGDFKLGDKVDAAFHLARNTFQGQDKLQLTVLDLKRSAG
jgi:single-stranded-DNA-specific exonuclease